MEWREREGVRWLEADLPGATAAFATRIGGVSEPPFDDLNLGALTDDDPEAVLENRRRLAGTLGFSPDRIAFSHQVHGADLLTHAHPPLPCSFTTNEGGKEQRQAEGGPTTPLRCSFASNTAVKAQRKLGGGSIPRADGHVVRGPGVAALVFVADCVPVAVAGPDGVAMLHCGWRGLAAGIIARGVEKVGASAAAVGPSIGPCCYEVGQEVLSEFASLGEGVSTRRMLDLPEVARRILLAAGVERIESSGLCTSCESELFFSHRRDAGRTGRQAGVAWLEDGS